MPDDKKALRVLFEDYDYYLAKMVALSQQIKEQATPYWKARGYTVIPRLERLRESVFSDSE